MAHRRVVLGLRKVLRALASVENAEEGGIQVKEAEDESEDAIVGGVML